MRNQAGFTFLEMLVVLALALCVLSVVEVATSNSARSSRQMQNNTQVRGVHQAMIMYSAGNGRYYPGLDALGENDDISVENRFFILLTHNYFTGEYAINPQEARTAWVGGPVTAAHYSYAMLQLPDTGGRRNEWRETLNFEAVAMGDRNIGTPQAPRSAYGPTSPSGWGCSRRPSPLAGDWRGSVAYNDNHVVFEQTHILATAYPRDDGQMAPHPRDDLFTAAGDDDAWLIHSGNGEPPHPLLPTP